MDRKLFIAGSTGAMGRTVVQYAAAQNVNLVAHVRPQTGVSRGNYDRKFDLADEAALLANLAGCTTVLQLIGTMRKRFSTGDTYEASDIGTTRQLMDAAKKSPSVDHIVLLSSVGAGRPIGAYLRAKAQAEALVRESGISYTIFRPSAFIGAGHKVNPLLAAVMRPFPSYRTIHVDELAQTILRVALDRAPFGVLEGESLRILIPRA